MHLSGGCVGGDAKKLLCIYIRINPRVSPSVCIINARNTNKKYLKKSFIFSFFPVLGYTMIHSEEASMATGVSETAAEHLRSISPLHQHSNYGFWTLIRVQQFNSSYCRGTEVSIVHSFFISKHKCTDRGGLLQNHCRLRPRDPLNIRGLLFYLIRVIKK